MSAKCCSILTLIWSFLVFFSFWGTIVFGYGYYAWSGNSDLHKYECYASNDKDVASIAYDTQDKDHTLHHVTANFQVVIIWGFFTYALMVFTFLCAMVVGEDGCLMPCIAFQAFVLAVSWLSHLITMMVMRWRHAGKVCSGDYLDDINRFAIHAEKPPYLHDTGSFLYYAINSQFFFMFIMMSGASIYAGMENNY